MPKIAKTLTEKEIQRITDNGFHAVGGVSGLYLRVAEKNRYWVFRYKINGKRKDFQFAKYPLTSLKQARDKATDYRRLLENQVDPREHSKSILAETETNQQRAKLRQTTLKEIAEEYISYHHDAGKWEKHPEEERRLISRLKKYVYPIIGDRFFLTITSRDIADVLIPLGQHVSTAEKVRHILSELFAWITAYGIAEKTNPVDPKALRQLLPRHQSKQRNQPMLPVNEIPVLMADIHSRPSISARCLEFCILTAVRSGNAREALWSEIDWKKKQWVIPAEKMKVPTNGDHVIPLADQVISFLKTLPRFDGCPYIFPSPIGNAPLSDGSLIRLLKDMSTERLLRCGKGYVDPKQLDNRGTPKRITAHGTARATFRTWAQDDELGNDRRFSAKTAELCLHHKMDDSYNGAYERNEAMKSRKEMMQAWADYCYSKCEEEPNDKR